MSAFIVNDIYAIILKFENDFERYAREELHLSNPFYDWLNDRKNSDNIKQWKEAKEKYVTKRIMRELGYEALIITPYKDMMQEVKPCEGMSGQCSFYCPKFFECGL